MKKFQTLYKKTSTGDTQQWSIEVDGNKITTRFGRLGGKIQVAEDVVTKGKNVGRSNETTPEEQALAEAQSTWEKKLKKDYVKTIDAAEKGEASELVAGGILPMLAHRFDKFGDKIKYPCFVQPKLDGHRCITGGPSPFGMWSRTRKPIRSVPHIEKEARRLIEGRMVRFDGELYNHDYRAKFEELSHFIRQSKPGLGHEVVQYHVYDLDASGTFRERWEELCEILGPKGLGPIELVETREVNNEDELMLAFEDFLAQGYEGAVARNADGLYVNKRSYDLQKIKTFLDSEATVVGVKEGRGKMAGHAVFNCVTDKGVAFDAKMKGALDSLKKYWDDPSLAIGKTLTVQYQGLTKDGAPRFPVALRFRKDV